MDGFHAHSGWYFKRKGNNVKIIKTVDARENSPIILEGEFDADTWASIVASVSFLGEDYDKFQKAYLLHVEPK